MISYPAIIEYDKEDLCYNVEFPDLEGCHTFGDTLEVALTAAKEALTGYLASIDARNIHLPKFSKLNGKNVHSIAPHKNVAFAIWLRLKRNEKGYTQSEMAELLNIKYQSYQRYENTSSSNPTLKRIEQIEDVLKENIVAV
ncbi:MAG: type II toxin-antitoxin system HicB family antitoxin [Leptospirales bacterium]